MKVYVILVDDTYKHPHHTYVEAYSTRKAARKRLNELVDAVLREEGDAEGFCVVYKEEDAFLYQEEGDYTRNHYEVTIVETELYDA